MGFDGPFARRTVLPNMDGFGSNTWIAVHLKELDSDEN